MVFVEMAQVLWLLGRLVWGSVGRHEGCWESEGSTQNWGEK